MWPDNPLTDQLDLELPIVQAPMAGAAGVELACAAIDAGALGSLPCAMLTADAVREQVSQVRERSSGALNLNFFCHKPPDTSASDADWQRALAPHYEALGVAATSVSAPQRAPFDDAMCAVAEDTRPEVVSFHFGLPDRALLARVKRTGALVLSTATTVREARWLEEHGCDVIIAQGMEAGGHRGMFLSDEVSTQPGTFALVPQVADAVAIPVIAAGGIGDGRGMVAAFALGACAVQVGTAYLLTDESRIGAWHRQALQAAADDSTALTNIFSGRPARGIMNHAMRSLGPLSDLAPPFPTAGGALAPLKARAEADGSGDYSSMWSGQAPTFARTGSAAALTRAMAEQARDILRSRADRSR